MTQLGQHLWSVPFKGTRKYAHSTDMIDLVLEQFAQETITRVKFSAHRFIATNALSVEISDTEGPAEGAFRGQISTETGTYWISINEAAGGEAVAPIPFDEARVTDACTVVEQSIILKGKTSYSLTEHVVPMLKALLETLYPEADGKWIFASSDYKERPESWEQLEVRVDHNFQNKLVKSSILVNGARIGFLYFSLVSS